MSHILTDIHRSRDDGFIFIPTFANETLPLSAAALYATEFMEFFENRMPFTAASITTLSTSIAPIRNAINARISYLASYLEKPYHEVCNLMDLRYFIVPILLINEKTGGKSINALYIPPDTSKTMILLQWTDLKYCKDDVMITEGWLDFTELKHFDGDFEMYLLDPATAKVSLEDSNFKVTLTSNEPLKIKCLPKEEMHIVTVPFNTVPDLLRVKSIDGMQSLNIKLPSNSLKQRTLKSIESIVGVTPKLAETLYANPGVHEFIQDGFNTKTVH